MLFSHYAVITTVSDYKMVSQLLCFCSLDEDICLFRLNHVSKDSLIDDRVHLEVGAHISVNSYPQWKKIIWSWTLQLVLYAAAGPGLRSWSRTILLVQHSAAIPEVCLWSMSQQLVPNSIPDYELHSWFRTLLVVPCKWYHHQVSV